MKNRIIIVSQITPSSPSKKHKYVQVATGKSGEKHNIKHNQDIYQNVESFRTTSIEGAEKIVAGRNKNFIQSAIFYNKQGAETIIHPKPF